MKAGTPLTLLAMCFATGAVTHPAAASTISDPGVIIDVSNGSNAITWNATVTGPAEVEFSPDLVGWEKVSTSNSTGFFEHSVGGAPKAFYRVKWKPLSPAQLAAEAALEEALDVMRASIPNDFAYTTGSEITGSGFRTYIEPAASAGGYWSSSGGRSFLDSGRGGEVTGEIAVFGTSSEGIVQRVDLKPLSATSSSHEVARYGYWVDDNTTKQNLSWWGGSYPRGVATNLSNLRFIFPSADGQGAQPPASGFADAVAFNRTISFSDFSLGGFVFKGAQSVSSLATIESYNFLVPDTDGLVNRYFFTKQSLSGFAAPNGQPRLNLETLRRYINSTTANQGASQPRAQLVDALLALPSSVSSSNWGGGNLSWLITTGKYTLTEAKQIVANLIDYLDDDLIPTTDSTEQPTYFGVEMRLAQSGAVFGHPVVNYLTVGLNFNRTTVSGGFGMINSTRVRCSVGMVYPWSETHSTSWYTPEITIAVEGDVVNGLPSLGTQAGAYFPLELTEQVNSRPVATFMPFSGYNFPSASGIAASTSYSTPFWGYTTGHWPARLPADVEFRNIGFRIERFRLKYTSAAGQSGYVFIMPKNLTIELDPATIAPGGGGGTFLVRVTDPAFANTKNLYLSSDPRAHFLAQSWTNLASQTNFGTNIPAPADGTGALDMWGNAGAETDGPQGVPTNFEWFRSSSLTNHLARASRAGMESMGEIGYLWTGKPWQTANLADTNNPATADWNLLDYLAAGSASGRSVLPLRTSSQGSSGVVARDLLADGGFNVSTRKLPTLKAVFADAADLSASAAEDVFNTTELPDWPAGVGSDNVSAYGVMARLSGILSSNSATKFQREAPQRAMANIVVKQSRSFTVYALGEHEKQGVVTRTLLEADVFVDADSVSGNPVLRVIDKAYR